MEQKVFKVAITGHRMERIKWHAKEIECWIKSQLKNLQEVYGNVVLIDGMADGVDQMAAFTAIKLGVPVYCYFPYKGKMNRAQTYIADNAAGIRYVCDEYQDECYFERDRRMVNDCDLLLVVWDGIESGGTWYTYNYARQRGKEILRYPEKFVV